MSLPIRLDHLTAAQLRTALIVATRNKNAAEKDRILREYARRGIKPRQNK